MKFFDKKKYIETEYEDRHIENLNKANVPYVIKERREFNSLLSMVYFVYSIILDCFVLLGIAYAILNIDKIF